MNSEPFILCDNLVKIHKVANLETVALQGLDLLVSPGELLGIVGPSGSGKTTLMNILGGLDQPSAGRVWVDGQDLLKMTQRDTYRYRRSKVGFVWQASSHNLVSYLSAWENIELPMTIARASLKFRRRWVAELLELIGLADRKASRLESLSGGEQQRVAIAVALANRPRLLLADEPTGEVDTATARQIYTAFQYINRELGLTILIVSHDPDVGRYVNRVIAIRDGRTSTETLRQLQIEGQPATEVGRTLSESDMLGEEKFIELTVLDSAGRLQLPKEYLDRFNIKGRVQLQTTDEGILIHPVVEANSVHSIETLANQLEGQKKPGMMRRFINKIRSR